MPFEATTAVMDTAELREMILLQLDNTTLLLSQRVCKNFKTTIERSKDIQQKLFFRFDNSIPNLRDMMRMGQGEYANPLLTSTSPEFYRGNGKFLKIQHGGLELAIAWVTLAPRYEAQLRTFAIEMRCGVEVIGPASKEKPSEGCESWRRMCLFRPGFVGIVHLGGEVLRIGEPKSSETIVRPFNGSHVGLSRTDSQASNLVSSLTALASLAPSKAMMLAQYRFAEAQRKRKEEE